MNASAQLVRVGNNVNQIARVLNSVGRLSLTLSGILMAAGVS